MANESKDELQYEPALEITNSMRSWDHDALGSWDRKCKSIRQDIRWYQYAWKLGYSVNMGKDKKLLLPNGQLPITCDQWTGWKPLIHCSGDSYSFFKDDKRIWLSHSGDLIFH
jgi:hypothetical protein